MGIEVYNAIEDLYIQQAKTDKKVKKILRYLSATGDLQRLLKASEAPQKKKVKNKS